MNQRQIAIITGLSLLLMAVFAGFSIGYAYPEFDDPEHMEFMKENIIQNTGLYYSMLIGILMIIILDFMVSYSLYKFFVEEHKNISLVSGIIRAAYTVIFGIATYYLTLNLYTNKLTNQIANENFEMFQTIWNSGLVVFGIHIILIAYLMLLHLKIPKVLSYITLIAGISYIMVSLLELLSLDSDMVNSIATILVLPMTIGELGLAIWLLIKGGKMGTLINYNI